MKKALFWISTIVIFACLIIVEIFKPDFLFGPDEGTSQPNSPSPVIKPSQEEKARIKATISQLAKEYNGRNKKYLDEFETRLAQAGKNGFERAHNNIEPFVSNMTSFTHCCKLSAYMAKDLLTEKQTAIEDIAPQLNVMIIKSCEDAHLEILDALNDFLVKVQENDNQFKAGLTTLMNQNNFSVLDLGISDDFLEDNMQVAQKIKDLAISKVFIAVGTAIEVFTIKLTYQAVRSTTAAVAKGMAASWAAGGACAVADGPIPIGDIVGGVIAIGGTILAVIDIYDVTYKLPAELRASLDGMINGYQHSLRESAMERAKAILKLCEESCQQITAECM